MSAGIRNPNFFLRRMHSLLGLLPMAAFVMFHLWENSQSRFGPAYYNHYVVEKIQGMNYIQFAEIFVVALPILFHAVYGVVIWWKASSNVTTFAYARNWMWWLQRASGFGILAFLIFHVGWTRIWSIFDHSVAQDMFGHMQRLLSNPVTLAAYVLGLSLSILHLCNGLWTMSISWGLLVGKRSQALAQWIALALGLVLLAFGVHGLLGFFMDTPVSNPLTPA